MASEEWMGGIDFHAPKTTGTFQHIQGPDSPHQLGPRIIARPDALRLCRATFRLFPVQRRSSTPRMPRAIGCSTNPCLRNNVSPPTSEINLPDRP